MDERNEKIIEIKRRKKKIYDMRPERVNRNE